jgi:galactokinase
MAIETYAPARAELLGNHTDYNEGLVMAIAINVGTRIRGEARKDNLLQLESEGFPDTWSGDLNALEPQKEPDPTWPNYMIGVAQALKDRGVKLTGATLSVSTTIPIGSGLSSSAALEMATALQMLKLSHAQNQVQLDDLDIARAGQWAEHQFSGVKCGLLDQISVLMGKAGHVTFIDCRSFEVRHVPVSDEVEFVIVHSGANHALTGGEYNERRSDCEEAARALGYPALRDVTPGELEERKGELKEQVYHRAAHVVGENARVATAVSCLAQGNMEAFGKLMFESHRSSIEHFANSCEELDFLVETAQGIDGCLGARLSGGGFGGATINLVTRESAESFGQQMAEAFRKKYSNDPLILVSPACDGAR